MDYFDFGAMEKSMASWLPVEVQYIRTFAFDHCPLQSCSVSGQRLEKDSGPVEPASHPRKR